MRFRSHKLRALVPFAVAAAFLALPAVGSAAERLVAVDEANRLVVFSSDTPRAITRVRVTGLGAGERLLGLDVRPANGQLVAVTSSSRLYTVDAATGVATAIGTAPFTPAVSGGVFGFDFNPTVDRIRLTSDARQNLRLNPDTGAIAAVDGTLTYATTDAGNGTTPQVNASAYTNSIRGATTTQLFDIDAARDVLVLQNPPNNGTLVTVGPLGVDAQSGAGFDIAPSDGIAWAALRVPGQGGSQLYRINLTNGAATLVGRIGGGVAVNGLAALGVAQADTTAPTLVPRQARDDDEGRVARGPRPAWQLGSPATRPARSPAACCSAAVQSAPRRRRPTSRARCRFASASRRPARHPSARAGRRGSPCA